MQIIMAIDDSRRLDGGGAGESASLIAQTIRDKQWGTAALPSRHRLYPHPSTGYRKHNTTRSFSADIRKEYLSDLIEDATSLIKKKGAADSNAGLAVVVPEQLVNPQELVEFSYRVKESLVTWDEALVMADKPGIYAFPLSGSGRGIIGALAGAGLRMTGNDGQFRGKLRIGSGEGHIASVKELVDLTYVEQVKNMDFELIGEEENVRMGEKVKVVLLNHKYTLMVFPTGIASPRWQTSTTHMLRSF